MLIVLDVSRKLCLSSADLIKYMEISKSIIFKK